jgi:hypothetical protein
MVRSMGRFIVMIDIRPDKFDIIVPLGCRMWVPDGAGMEKMAFGTRAFGGVEIERLCVRFSGGLLV